MKTILPAGDLRLEFYYVSSKLHTRRDSRHTHTAMRRSLASILAAATTSVPGFPRGQRPRLASSASRGSGVLKLALMLSMSVASCGGGSYASQLLAPVAVSVIPAAAQARSRTATPHGPAPFGFSSDAGPPRLLHLPRVATCAFWHRAHAVEARAKRRSRTRRHLPPPRRWRRSLQRL